MQNTNGSTEFAGALSPAEEETIRRLLVAAGPLPPVPDDAIDALKAGAKHVWLRKVRARRRRSATRWTVGLAAAAVLAVAIGVTLLRLRPEAPGSVAATVDRVTGGTVVAAGDGDALLPLRPGETVAAGAQIETGQGRLALRLAAGGPTLRLDVGTRLRLASAAVGELDEGGLYLESSDSPRRHGEERFEIHTPLGFVRDVGTRFEVRLAADELRVRVRQGAVAVRAGDRAFDVAPGGELMLGADGTATSRSVALTGGEWDWLLDVASPFELEGSTVGAFLGWVARETGREVRYADPAVAASAPGIVLHGSVASLRPDDALAAVLPSCGLTHRFEGGLLVVERLAGGR